MGFIDGGDQKGLLCDNARGKSREKNEAANIISRLVCDYCKVKRNEKFSGRKKKIVP